jgi:hypothetical protein
VALYTPITPIIIIIIIINHQLSRRVETRIFFIFLGIHSFIQAEREEGRSMGARERRNPNPKTPLSSKEPWGLSAPGSDHLQREPCGLERGFPLLAKKLPPCD